MIYEYWLAGIKEITDLKVKTTSPNLVVKNLSGGNQQKVVLAKWMLKNPGSE